VAEEEAFSPKEEFSAAALVHVLVHVLGLDLSVCVGACVRVRIMWHGHVHALRLWFGVCVGACVRVKVRVSLRWDWGTCWFMCMR
jgi:hypothetical protein